MLSVVHLVVAVLTSIIFFNYCVQKRRDIGQPYCCTVLNTYGLSPPRIPLSSSGYISLSSCRGINHVDKALTGLSVKIRHPKQAKAVAWEMRETNKYTFHWDLNVEQRNKNIKSNWNQFLLERTTMGLCPFGPATPFPQIVLIPIFAETEFFIFSINSRSDLIIEFYFR